MKRLFAALFCSFVMAGYAFAEEPSYEIDPVATANAPWKVGELIFTGPGLFETSYYRKFLGVTDSGHVLVQEFRTFSGKKFTDPFLVRSIEAAKLNSLKALYPEIDGVLIMRYANGQKALEANYKNGRAEGLVTQFYENGQKKAEGNVKNDAEIGIWREWDEKGNLIKEQDFGDPKD